MRRPHRTTTFAAATLSVALVATLAGCSLLGQAPAPDDAAGALAAGLAKADLSGVSLKGTTAAKATAFVQKAYQGMGDLRPTVTVKTVSHTEDSAKATATLETRWDVSASPTDWTYQSKAVMSLVDGQWQVSWTPRLVAPDLTSDETLTIERRWPRRADIVDASGGKLMTEREVSVVGIDKSSVSGSQATASARRLAALV